MGCLKLVESDKSVMDIAALALVNANTSIDVFVEHVVHEDVNMRDVYYEEAGVEHENENDQISDKEDNVDDISFSGSEEDLNDDLEPRIVKDVEEEYREENNGEEEGDQCNNEVDGEHDLDSMGEHFDSNVENNSRFPSFKNTMDPSEIWFKVGMLFSSLDEFKIIVSEYAINRGWSIHFEKSDKTRVRARCLKTCL